MYITHEEELSNKHNVQAVKGKGLQSTVQGAFTEEYIPSQVVQC